MSFSAEGIAAIIVALAGFVSGLYNLMQARRVQAIDQAEATERDAEESRQKQRDAERLLETAMRHIHLQSLALARAGLPEIPLPKELQ